MRINPTGGSLDEVFVAEISGFDENNEMLVNETLRFNWFQDAFSWPTSLGFETDSAQVVRVTVMLRRVAQNNQPVRLLIDDLNLTYSPEIQDFYEICILRHIDYANRDSISLSCWRQGNGSQPSKFESFSVSNTL